MTVLETELSPFRVSFLDAETRSVLARRTIPASEWPHIVVFGDLQVLLEDRLLQSVATRPGVHRVLVSTHHNLELIRTAQEYCGFDRHLTLPLSAADIRHALEQVSRVT